MELKLLCVGDVVGEPGRRVLREAVAALREQHGLDCVVVNAENVAGGSGLTAALYEKILQGGVDVITLGDHVYRRRDIIPILETESRIVRPANFPVEAPGKDYIVTQTASGHAVAVIVVMGRLYMKPVVDCPFKAVDRALAALPADVKIVVVEVHAEATSEKIALGWHLDGRASVVFGTHTHVQTADERVLPKGTAYITDLGSTGPASSVIGFNPEISIRRVLTQLPLKNEVSESPAHINGAVVVVDLESGLAQSIETIREESIV